MMRRRVFRLALLLASAPLPALAQTPADQLAKPPADARHFVIESTGGKHGDAWLWRAGDGGLLSRESMNLRGQVWNMDVRIVPGADGTPQVLAIRGIAPSGDATESFERKGGRGDWKSPVDSGGSEEAAGRYYISYGGLVATNVDLVERLLAAPGQRLKLLPGGEARAVRLTTADVGAGATRQTVILWEIYGLGNTPVAVWADGKGGFFGTSSGIGVLPEAYAGELAHLEQVQTAAQSASSAAIAKQFAALPTAPIAFTHVRLFDAEGLRFLDDQTVVVDKGRIVAVGAAASVAVPQGARTIDGKGKTLLPGLWDCHMHVGDDYTGPQELSLGVTSVRDPGNNDALTIDRRNRAAAGTLLMPHVYASSLIDGKGVYTAQVANVATSQDEAVALVRKAKAGGFIGVKFYGTFDPAWLPAAIAEAHRLGLHVHGHIPHGIRPSEAVRDGYDEITHINWIVMEGVPAEVLPGDNGIARFQAPGRYAKDMDTNHGPVADLVGTMARKHIYSDPTMVAFEGLYVVDGATLGPAYAPFVGTLPPTTERGFRGGAFAPPEGVTRADYRASWAKMVALLGQMHKAGVPIVAGTDGSGIEIIRELEIYHEAGFSPAEAIAAATIVPARLVGKDAETGSVKTGKVADLVLVEGDPEKRIGDLRHTRLVMFDGHLLDADALRSAAGFAGMPK